MSAGAACTLPLADLLLLHRPCSSETLIVLCFLLLAYLHDTWTRTGPSDSVIGYVTQWAGTNLHRLFLYSVHTMSSVCVFIAQNTRCKVGVHPCQRALELTLLTGQLLLPVSGLVEEFLHLLTQSHKVPHLLLTTQDLPSSLAVSPQHSHRWSSNVTRVL